MIIIIALHFNFLQLRELPDIPTQDSIETIQVADIIVGRNSRVSSGKRKCPQRVPNVACVYGTRSPLEFGECAVAQDEADNTQVAGSPSALNKAARG